MTARFRLGRAAAAILLMGLVVILGVEIGVRILGIAPALPRALVRYSSSPYLAWGPVPLSQYQGVATTGEYVMDLRHNSLGFRDTEHALAKPPGTFRILGLGDSFTYGSGAQFEETYLYRLERALNSRPGAPRPVEVIKAGVSRFFPEPERVLLERLGMQFSPDLVIVGFTANDILDTCLGPDAIAITAHGDLVNSPLAELGSLGVLLYRYSHAARIVLRAWVSGNILRRCPAGAAIYQPDGPHEGNWRAVEDELARMAVIARQGGARLLVINIPDPPPWTQAQRYPAARLGAWARDHGIAFLDLLPAMQAASGSQPLYWQADPHCTPAGYAVVAEALGRYLVSSGLVP